MNPLARRLPAAAIVGARICRHWYKPRAAITMGLHAFCRDKAQDFLLETQGKFAAGLVWRGRAVSKLAGGLNTYDCRQHQFAHAPER